ncbi:Eco57I restriction-modification methylase domain-containing protein [Gephyromycinifex aptenodytis]|uniref:Eco57I restriction-modification methylase domain-containing protein n=1 Tax=Gephyromycinifex aptenodytis TaxID=2716227 RepID=UPI0014481AD7|nr:DNA methyltransferase [Gephyromycinifex aptenodytis]
MPVSDALVVGEDWISEHYFTTDATKESFHKRVLDRRKAWDQEDAKTTRTRFTAQRGEIERRLIRLASLTDETGEDDTPGMGRLPLTDDERQAVLEIDDLLLGVLGYRTGEFTLRDDGPLTFVAPPGTPDAPSLVIVRARPVATIDDLIAKKAPTLLEPWWPQGQESSDVVTSVAAALSRLMTDADGPAFGLVLAGRWCLIAERERWPEGRWLAVDLQLVCERNDAKRGGEIDRALACLDAASLAPDAAGTTWWAETLEDSAKHTVGVSKDLREGVRLSIEIIANEVVQRRAAQGLEPLPADQAQPLAKQALRYLYRILFLLYAEASPELGVLPVGAQEYDAGYGLDRLRDLALTEIHSERSRWGTHLYESLDRLFVLVDTGHAPTGDDGLAEGLEFHGLRADLFRPQAIEHIAETKLGNDALLRVLRMLLLTKESKKSDRGFISYVELGINQLGAVYEGLMSYTGSFATEDLFEVAKGGDASKGSWVVPVHRSSHLDPADFVKVRNENTGEDEPVLHRKGTFVFRLSGRDRQRSASYYTPEVLTRFTVQQALEELLDQDGSRTSAAEILQLTVCEPALGSGAFAIEAVRQLAEAYLTRRQEETGERIDPEAYPAELQKVKAHLALHQVYGVDLNATAVELAEVSLWLDTMVAGLQAPWFGLRLRPGNSLVGARHAFYAPEDLSKKAWLTRTPTDRPLSELAQAVGAGRPPVLGGAIHHFLLPAQGWGSAVEVPKAVRDLVPPEKIKAVKAWRSSVRKAPNATQVKLLQALATRVETLWSIALRRLTIAEAESSRAIDVWGLEREQTSSSVSREQIEASLADPDGAWQRLHTLMNAWCALWFWPLTEDDVAPPSFEQWLDACRMILGAPEKVKPSDTKRGDGSLFSATAWDALNDEETNDRIFAQAATMASIREAHPWLGVCDRIAGEQGFFHWKLDFATVFARGGFDLQVGNPPWVRPRTDVEALLAESDPWWALALKPTEEAKAEHRVVTLQVPGTRQGVVDGTAEVVVLAELLGDATMYPLLSAQPDLYRAFMTQVWQHASPAGMSVLIHLESHFTDDKATRLRRETYRRLRRHWQFINELKLFEIQDQKTFGVNVYGASSSPRFLQAASLYHPDTVLRSERHDGSGAEPGFKDDEGRWDVRPHASRIQAVDERILGLWADVLGSSKATTTQMLYTQNASSSRTLAQLSASARLGVLGLQFSRGWDESIDRKAGRFHKEWGPAPWENAILQGPHLYVSSPLYKAPNASMLHQQDWTTTDFEMLSPDALPVTSYKPAGDRAAYDANYTHWGDDRTPARDHYRVAWRAMAANTGERTLIPALIPPGATHVHTVTAVGAPGRPKELVVAAAVMSTLLADFLVRSAPKSAITPTVINNLPFVPMDHPLITPLILRTLRLNCVTDAYADLWAQCWDDTFLNDEPILPRYDERPIGPEWTPDTPLRRAADRRNAQVEIDAMAAIMLGVPIEDLCTIYRTQFAVLYGYDQREYTYDANGRLVPNSVSSVWRKLGEPQDPSQMSDADRTATHPGSSIKYTCTLPFTVLDREVELSRAILHLASFDQK